MKIAIVHDWLTNRGGAENTVEEIMRTFPTAVLYTSVYDRRHVDGFYTTQVHTTFLQKIPFVKYKHKFMSYLRSVYFEQLDLSEYDLVISSSHAEAKGVITKPHCTHVCYCHTPTRYFWSDYAKYIERMEFGKLNPIVRKVFPILSDYMRLWDRSAADRVDRFIANSSYVAQRITKYYRQNASVVYPPVDTEFFDQNENVKREEFYFTVSRIIPYKQIDLIAQAFAKWGKPIVIAGEGPLRRSLIRKYKAYKNISFVGYVSKEELRSYYQKAKGFIFASEEDFGIVPVEAQACGCPVLAYAKGGALESIVENVTGMFFHAQECDVLVKALEAFEQNKFIAADCRDNAQRFSKENFRLHLRDAILQGRVAV